MFIYKKALLFLSKYMGARFTLPTVSAGDVWAVGPLPVKCFIFLAGIFCREDWHCLSVSRHVCASPYISLPEVDFSHA